MLRPLVSTAAPDALRPLVSTAAPHALRRMRHAACGCGAVGACVPWNSYAPRHLDLIRITAPRGIKSLRNQLYTEPLSSFCFEYIADYTFRRARR